MPEIRTRRRRKKRIIQIYLINNSGLYYILNQIFSPPNDVRSKIYVFNSLGITSNGRSDDIRSVKFCGNIIQCCFRMKTVCTAHKQKKTQANKSADLRYLPVFDYPNVYFKFDLFSAHFNIALQLTNIHRHTRTRKRTKAKTKKINKHFSSQLICQYVCCVRM